MTSGVRESRRQAAAARGRRAIGKPPRHGAKDSAPGGDDLNRRAKVGPEISRTTSAVFPGRGGRCPPARHADAASPLVHDRKPPDLAFLHEPDGLLEARVLRNRHAGARHAIAGRQLQGVQSFRHGAAGDVAIRHDPDRPSRVHVVYDGDSAAVIVHEHRGDLAQRCFRRTARRTLRHDLFDLHSSPLTPLVARLGPGKRAPLSF